MVLRRRSRNLRTWRSINARYPPPLSDGLTFRAPGGGFSLEKPYPPLLTTQKNPLSAVHDSLFGRFSGWGIFRHGTTSQKRPQGC